MNKKNKPFKKEIKTIEQIFSHENISARIAYVDDNEVRTMYYIQYLKYICPYDIACVVDSFAIALGGVKLCFIPVIEGKPFSALMVDKVIEKPIDTNMPKTRIEQIDDVLYKKVTTWSMTKQFVSISNIQIAFGIGFNKSGRILLRMQNDGIIASDPTGIKGYRVLVN